MSQSSQELIDPVSYMFRRRPPFDVEEMILWHYHPPKPSRRILWAAACMFAMLLVFLVLGPCVHISDAFIYQFVFPPYFLVFGWLIVELVPLLRQDVRDSDMREKVRRRAKRIPARRLLAICKMYGWTDGYATAIECEETHLSGDCPLCGAT